MDEVFLNFRRLWRRSLPFVVSFTFAVSGIVCVLYRLVGNHE